MSLREEHDTPPADTELGRLVRSIEAGGLTERELDDAWYDNRDRIALDATRSACIAGTSQPRQVEHQPLR